MDEPSELGRMKPVKDLLSLLLIGAFFITCYGLVALCDRLGGPHGA